MSREDGSGTPLTEQDTRLLGELRTMLESVDPMPPGLVERVRFALDLDAVDAELARLVELPELAGARSDELTRLMTFQSDSLTIMITVEQHTDGTTRIDGWLTPGGCHHIELRCSAGPMSAESDDSGRFSLDAVPAGTVRFVVHGVGNLGRVLTPAIEI